MTGKDHEEDKYSPDFWRNYLNGFKGYFNSTHDYIVRKDKEYGNMKQWQEERKKLLVRVGRSTQAAFALVQILQKNFNSARGRTVFQKAEWEKESAYSHSAKNSRELIFDFMEPIVRADIEEGTISTDTMDKIFTYSCEEERADENNSDIYKDLDKAVGIITQSGDWGYKFSHDTEKIWDNLQRIVKKHPN